METEGESPKKTLEETPVILEKKETDEKKKKSKKNIKTHVSDAKKAKVKELAEQMKRNTVMVISIKGLPSAQFQDIKKKLREKATIMVAKKSTVDFALDHCGIKEIHDLVPYVDESTAILFSDKDAFEISGVLADEKSPAKAKAGQEAPEDLIVEAGPTELLPGPDISALSAVGLQPKVEDGKIAIAKNAVLCKKGEIISDAKASILAKLDIIPFEVGVEPVAAYMGGKVYADIKINKVEMIADLEESFGRALPFAVEIGYVNDITLDYILGKASLEGGAIELLIVEDKPTEAEKEEAPAEKTGEKPAEKKKEEKTNTEEVKVEESAEAASE
jgi:large subunit ribosomal protein L10